MLEQLVNSETTHGGENVSVESISRKDIGLAWLGAIIEGEGCIYAGFRDIENENHLTVRVTVYNTHPRIIRRTTEILLENGVNFYVSNPGKPTKSKPGVAVVIGGKGRVRKFLDLVMPHLYAKRRRAELIIQLIDYRESLAQPGKRATWHGALMAGDPEIKRLIGEIREEVHNYPSVLDFSRQANSLFGESSETLRLPQLAFAS